jgi:antitoxin component HigA of HigAB toxin-antitoxin module
MPKEKLTQEAQMELELQALIRKYMVLRGLKSADLMQGIGMTKPTFYKKMKNGGSLTLTELRMLQQRLKIPGDELSAVIGV